MSKEQRTPFRRQFIKPLSLIPDNEPASSPEISMPLSRPVMGETADLTKLTTLKTPVVIPEQSTQQWSPPPFFTELQTGKSDAVFTPVEPTSSAWAMPAPRQHTSGLFSAGSSVALPPQDMASAAWAMLQVEQDLAAKQAPISRGAPQTEQQAAVAQAGPISEAWALPQPEPSAPVSQTFQAALQTKPPIAPSLPQQQKNRKKRVPIWFAACSMIVIVVLVLGLGNGTVGAWAADTFRAIVGPVATAQIEAWYLNAQNKVQQWQFQASGQHVNSPWKLTPTAVRPTPTPTPPAWSTMKPMPLSAMQPIISPALDGEGTWNVLEQAPKPYNYLPLSARAFIRPDPAYPYAIVTLLQFDARFSHLHIVSGTQEPGGPLGNHGAGIIPKKDQQDNTLLAALNGGFKYADGAYGLMTNGVVYVPPQPKTATIAITREGKLLLGSWGIDPQLKSDNKDLIAWRQNASLLIDKGVINPLTKDGAAWGGTILNSEYTWRSGLGITAEGNLVYAAGNALVPETLGKALLAAGAVTAMETDINPFWVRAFLYQRDGKGNLTITKLNPQMQGTGYEYLNVDQRDFFYLTRYAPPIDGAKPTPTPKAGTKSAKK
jgi:hypothetical protein